MVGRVKIAIWPSLVTTPTLWSTTDIITEYVKEGTDTVQSSVSFTLANNLRTDPAGSKVSDGNGPLTTSSSVMLPKPRSKAKLTMTL